ncbi:MAG: LacI family DNA-binding transcriptional regulator [Chloroflexota bacterium]
MKPHKRPTIKEVALAAGVSTQTVSRVINARPDVSPETRQHVQEVIEKLDYQPSALARSLIQQRSYTLGVVTAGLKYIGPSRTLNGITFKAEELGYSLLLKELPRFDTNNIVPLIQSLLARHVDGIIWAVPEVGDNRSWLEKHLADLPVPIVFLAMHPYPSATVISVDNYLGARLATTHLIEQGRHHIGHISGPLDWWEARQRLDGWQDTLKEAGFQVSNRHWVEGNWSSSSGAEAIQQLFQQYPEMDAIFVANDQMALGVMQIACKRGLSIPRDLVVVGFDNIVESAYFWPPLTTIQHDQHTLGCMAVQEIVGTIEDSWQKRPAAKPKNILLQPTLLIRESSTAKVKMIS